MSNRYFIRNSLLHAAQKCSLLRLDVCVGVADEPGRLCRGIERPRLLPRYFICNFLLYAAQKCSFLRLGVWQGDADEPGRLCRRIERSWLIRNRPLLLQEREILLTTCWSESTQSSRYFSTPALRQGSLNSLFQVALYLPSSCCKNPSKMSTPRCHGFSKTECQLEIVFATPCFTQRRNAAFCICCQPCACMHVL